MAHKRKLCIFWQGRKAVSGAPTKKYGVYERCLPESAMSQALAMTKQIGRRRKGGAALVERVGESNYTLMTCFGKRCKVTLLGQKFGLKSSRK